MISMTARIEDYALIGEARRLPYPAFSIKSFS
jgi:hypothetical protein